MKPPREQLEDIRKLEAGWDGPESKPIDPALIDAVIAWVDAMGDDLPSSAWFVPFDETVICEFEKIDGKSLGIDFESPTQISVFMMEGDFDDMPEFALSDYERARGLIKWFKGEGVKP